MSLSPAKKTSAKPGEAAATARELELLAMAMQSNKNDIQIDYNKFAELAAFKNAASARAGWKRLKDKFELGGGGTAANGADSKTGGDDEIATSEAPKTLASGKKRKVAAKGDEAEETPKKSAKKGRKPAAKGKKAAATADQQKEDGNEAPGAKGDWEEAQAVEEEFEEV